MYQASTKGQIKALKKTRKSGKHYQVTRVYPEKIFKDNITSRGYKIVGLRKNNKSFWFSIHRLIAKTFITNPFNKPEVNHKDCNKLNNSANNLEWSTRKENAKHAYDNGLQTGSLKKGGPNHSSRPVFDFENGIVYKSITEAYEAIGFKFSKSYFECMLSGRNKNITNFIKI